MANSEHINLLIAKLENLLIRHQGFEAEIKALREELRQLQSPDSTAAFMPPPRNTPLSIPTRQPAAAPTSRFADNFKRANLGKSDFEKFIGENLISKIGILILIIGVAIGAKYAIDHQMISPLTRMILGYSVGIALMAFAIKLKAKYKSFSAVLVSGAIAILYFITYAAYDFYALMPQTLAFALMVIFTCFTVVAALQYNKQVIAHIGLVGAYAVPFLLSDGSGNVLVLFTYIAIINIGILTLSFKKYWKPLFYSSFGFTWLIFLAWRLDLSSVNDYFTIALLFSSLFFIIFYISNLAYKVIKEETFGLSDVIILLLNSFIYYGIGYLILSDYKYGSELLGLFTLANALVHFMVCLVIYKRKLADKNLFYMVLAMVITFITMAAPVQLDGNWVTIFWSVEAAVLFYLGRVKNIQIYQKLAVPLIVLAFFSLVHDWANYYDQYEWAHQVVTPILNVNFLTALMVSAAFAWMFFINSATEKKTENVAWVTQILNFGLPSMLVILSYFTFSIEISKYFNNQLETTKIGTHTNHDYYLLNIAWIYVYTLFFAATLTLLNIKKFRQTSFTLAVLLINALVILSFLTQGLYNLSLLRDSFIAQSDRYFNSGMINIIIRYISIAFFALLMVIAYPLSRTELFNKRNKILFDYICYISILWILSSELINIIELSGLSGSYKLGLSILWGVYALFLIIMGLAKKKKHLRIGAIILFGGTLVKLFLYDIAYLNTISKTIVFVSLGVLLLIISFLYNKYKHLITDDADVEN